MFINANEIKRESVIKADVCIVGSGAAGIAIARSLKDTPLRIVIVESGDREKNSRIQKLNEIETTHLPIGNPHRARQFGGTTTLWVGRLKPHDKIDFEKRSWIQNSGWPISLSDLIPYYKKASELLSAPEYESFDTDSKDIQGQRVIESERIKRECHQQDRKEYFSYSLSLLVLSLLV